jgi:hypothetical protein
MAASWTENEGKKRPAAGNRRYAQKCSEKDMIHTRGPHPVAIEGAMVAALRHFSVTKASWQVPRGVAARL